MPLEKPSRLLLGGGGSGVQPGDSWGKSTEFQAVSAFRAQCAFIQSLKAPAGPQLCLPSQMPRFPLFRNWSSGHLPEQGRDSGMEQGASRNSFSGCRLFSRLLFHHPPYPPPTPNSAFLPAGFRSVPPTPNLTCHLLSWLPPPSVLQLLELSCCCPLPFSPGVPFEKTNFFIWS